MKPLPLFTITLLTVGLSACATPETKLRQGLENAGLSPRMSACMAERMVDRLSVAQLRRLSSLKSMRKRPAGDLSVNEILHDTRGLRDPEIVAVTSASALHCAF